MTTMTERHTTTCGQLCLAVTLVESVMRHSLDQPGAALLVLELNSSYLALVSAAALAHKDCTVARRRPSWQPDPPGELVAREWAGRKGSPDRVT